MKLNLCYSWTQMYRWSTQIDRYVSHYHDHESLEDMYRYSESVRKTSNVFVIIFWSYMKISTLIWSYHEELFHRYNEYSNWIWIKKPVSLKYMSEYWKAYDYFLL